MPNEPGFHEVLNMAEVTTDTWLVAILASEQVADTNKEGDVISIVQDKGFIGQAEAKPFIWLRCLDIPLSVMEGQGEVHTDGSSRFSVPFEKLGEIATAIGKTFDEALARDPNVVHQIHVEFNPVTGINEVTGVPIVGLNVFYDKGPKGYIV